MEHEVMTFDVLIVGAGPAGLSAACRLKQLDPSIEVCVLEKGAEVGAHILSGAVFDPRALNELFPDWKERGAPLNTAVTEDRVYWCRNSEKAYAIPSLLMPFTMHNQGAYIISLGDLCRWLANQAEALGIEIFPEFCAADIVYSEGGSVKGVRTGAKGLDVDGNERSDFMPAMEIHASQTLFAEGCRGHLGKQLINHYQLDAGREPQHYGLGIKEIWRVPPERHKPGLVVHSAGWPLNETSTSGGGFLYHLENHRVAVGLVTDLSYSNPHLNPYDEFQRFKHQLVIRRYLEGGERLAYGARSLTKGGIQSLPKMSFPGGMLLGDNAGTLNFAKIKGSHTAMKSGMLAAETIARSLKEDSQQSPNLDDAFARSWVYEELYQQRNFGPAQHKWGNFWGSAYSFLDLNIFRGRLPWTLSDPIPDHKVLKKASLCRPVKYPAADGKLSFDKLSSVYLSNTNHEENQPCHLLLADNTVPASRNLTDFDEPAQRYCPAGVYEFVEQEGNARHFQINAQNCLHCKACDIKDPSQNITWVTPEGGGGPNYVSM